MKALVACLASLPIALVAAPIVFEETARIPSPDPTFSFPRRVAVEGDTIIATGLKFDGAIEHHTAFLFRRQSNGSWSYVRALATTSCDSGEVAEDTCTASVAIRNGVAVVAAGKVHVFTRTTDGNWVAAPSNGFTGPGDAAIGTNALFTSEPFGCGSVAQALRKNSAGVWALAATFQQEGIPVGCDPWGRTGDDIDASLGNRLIVAKSEYADEVHIYEPSMTSWTQTAALTSPVNGVHFGDSVAIDDSRAFVSGTLSVPIHVFSRSTGTWLPVANIVTPDGPPRDMKVRGLLIASFSGRYRNGSVGVFREASANTYVQVGRLVASGTGVSHPFLGGADASTSGSMTRIVATGNNAVYVFDVSNWGTTSAPLSEDFETGNAPNWTPMAGSTFSVVTAGASKVYRQSSVAGDAGSFVTGIDRTNQAIEADVKPTAFNGSNRWVGLAVRRTDANNYYYLTLRQTNVLELKRIVNGAIVSLDSTSLPVVLNRNYRLRLEAVGTLVRGYVDGRLAVEAYDTTLKHGHAGVRMWQARADFDNVILSQNPQLTLQDNRGNYLVFERWSFGPGNWSEVPITDGQRLVQQDTSGDARAATLVPVGDQIVQVRAAATSFATGTGVRWFGVMARYVDAQNFYYLTVRSDNTISLRKLVNGSIHVLDSAPFSVTTGTRYALRLEAIGNSLRAYVNGNVLLEANDTSHPRGKTGVVMYKAASTFDDFTAWEP